MADTWLRVTRDDSGGTIKNTVNTGTKEILHPYLYQKTGYECEITSPVSYWNTGIYNAYSYTSYFKFDISSLTASPDVAYVHVRNHYNYMTGSEAISNKVGLHVKTVKNTEAYPYTTLASSDFATTGWSLVSTIGTIGLMTVPAWKSVDVTSEVQAAYAAGLSWFGIMLRPTAENPSGWNLRVVVDPPERCYVNFYSDMLPNADVDGSEFMLLTPQMPSGFPDTRGYMTPYLQLTYSDSGDLPVPTPSVVNAVAADPKRAIGLAGTESGNLWKLDYYVSTSWTATVAWFFRAPIKSILMDVNSNFQDTPQSQITYVGLGNGEIWKSTKSLSTFYRLSGFYKQNVGADSVIEIRGSDMPGLIAAIAGNTVYMSKNAGDTWYFKSYGYAIRGLFVRGLEIQVAVYFPGSRQIMRSSDFGTTWYLSSIDVAPTDIAFDAGDYTKSVVLVSNKLYYNTEVSESQFNYSAGASIAGTGRVIDADERGTMYVGTSTNLYKTNDRGVTVTSVRSGYDFVGIATGGELRVEG